MTKQQLQRVEELFHQAADLGPKQRAAFLDSQCSQDPDLRAMVEDLLKQDETTPETKDFLVNPLAMERDTAGVPVEGSTLQPLSPGRGKSSPPVLPSDAGYEILGELGRGGMGVVYKARQIALQRVVALKMLLAGSPASAEQRARFRTEAEAMARLQHPNIVQIYEVSDFEGRPYFAMEYVPGPSLGHVLDGTPLLFQPAAQLVECLARAIHHAHEHGILHRDLKPGNILLAPNPKSEIQNPKQIPITQEENPKTDGVPVSDLGNLSLDIVSDFGSPTLKREISDFAPKVTDFGLARDQTAAQRMTQTGQGMGTPSYMAPEQARGDVRAVGPPVDIYALGSILYELLTGRPPFEEATPAETIVRLLSEEPLSPARLRARLPRDLETICLKCLEKEPRKRYASALDLAEDLRRFQAREPIHARPVGSIERAWRWCRRRPVVASLLALSAALAVALVASIVVALIQSKKLAESERQQLVQLNVTIGMRDLEDGDFFTAILWLTRALQADAGRPEQERKHRIRIATALRQCPLLVQLLVLDQQVLSTSFTAGGCRTATAGEDHVVRVWDVKTRQPVGSDLKHDGAVAGAAFSPDGRLLATAGENGTVRVWTIRTGKPRISPFPPGRPVTRLAFHDDGKVLLVRRADFVVQVWDLASGKRLPLQGHPAWPLRFSTFSDNGRWVFLLDASHKGRVWDPLSGKPVTHSMAMIPKVTQGAISPDGRRLALASRDNAAWIWDMAAGKMLAGPLRQSRPITQVSFGPQGKRLITVSDKHTVQVWQAATGTPLIPPLPHRAVTKAGLSPDGRLLVTCGEDNRARVWNTATGAPFTPLLRHNGSVIDAAFSPNGDQVVTVGNNGVLRLWQLSRANPATERQQVVNEPVVPAKGKSPDGRRMLKRTGQNVMHVVDTATGKDIGRPLQHGSVVNHGAFSPDGRQVVTASDDNTARIWSADTGEPLAPPLQHKGNVLYAAFSPDGLSVITASEDHTARVWDTATGLPLTPPFEHPRGVVHASFSADAQRAITRCSGEVLPRTWDLTPDDRRIDDLVRLAQVLSGSEIQEEHGLVPLPAAELRKAWEQIQAGKDDQEKPASTKGPR